MNYNKLAYITPPRAEQAIPKSFLSIWEGEGWIAQVKKNGTNTVIFVDPDKNMTFMSRHGTELKAWSPTTSSTKIFKDLPDDKWYVFNAELMNNKTKNVKDTLYIFDILVYHDQYLLGTTYSQRYKLMMNMFLTGKEQCVESHFVLNNNAWLARNIASDFSSVFKKLKNDEDEGLVLKNPNGQLTFDKNDEWMVKCRRTQGNDGKFNKSYSF